MVVSLSMNLCFSSPFLEDGKEVLKVVTLFGITNCAISAHLKDIGSGV
jgi:hypothetical protein